MNQILDINLLQLVQQLKFLQEHVMKMLMYDELSTKMFFFYIELILIIYFKIKSQTCKSSENFLCKSLIRFQFLLVTVNATAGNVKAP